MATVDAALTLTNFRKGISARFQYTTSKVRASMSKPHPAQKKSRTKRL
jgi:hypothetical protein